ncbi:CCA tRNA nucleotidyltransferase [Lacicoccus qingdaonensis]|uniref:tRNA nucleotidyltransferase (CCA-adding enzyme) n=1 Tax=Lacicoccus qingdaonensis TaxID=576118 RepID=A0A1G9CJP6_9BACL|nr:CCA tRNA nucleotidyltransferase [Salinicoccus qingdaonensis]SDK51786.1 tRNA nucleotidyltransferase (CCA-adding enzyme) [Salinicoccus qingdaonensis]
MNELFRIGETVISTLNENGFEAYFVGGCVRDYYMDRQVHDVDITTDAKPDEIEALFEKTIDVGKAHGTIIVLVQNIPFEVTTYRADGEHGVRLLDEDLKRRDFTMNAMAMSQNMIFYDPFSGRDAIEKKEIITVGEPDERFEEDPLRIIRAIRFMSVLKFSIELSTEKSMMKNVHTVEYISVERIVGELKKTYAGDGLKHAKKKLVQAGLKAFIPFLKHIGHDEYLHSHAEDFMDELIIHSVKNDGLTARLKDLKLSNAEIELVKSSRSLLQAVAEDVHPREIAYQYHEDVIRRLIRLNQYNELIEDVSALDSALALQPSLIIRSKKDLDINGRHLMNLYDQKSGPWIKECLNIIENEVLFERLNNNHDDIIKWVKKHVEFGPESIEVIK